MVKTLSVTISLYSRVRSRHPHIILFYLQGSSFCLTHYIDASKFLHESSGYGARAIK